MPAPNKSKSITEDPAVVEKWPGISSHFLLIAVAALRHKQLARGSRPRIEADPRRNRNTSIALEEVKQGLIPFTVIHKLPKDHVDFVG
jgi:DNA-directed RNA polymerase omega subunit